MLSTPIEIKTPSLKKNEIIAIQQTFAGKAEPYQQKLAIVTIVNKLSRAQDLLYVPDRSDATMFLNGRAFVGQQVHKTLNIKVGKIPDDEEVDQHE